MFILNIKFYISTQQQDDKIESDIWNAFLDENIYTGLMLKIFQNPLNPRPTLSLERNAFKKDSDILQIKVDFVKF